MKQNDLKNPRIIFSNGKLSYFFGSAYHRLSSEERQDGCQAAVDRGRLEAA